MAATVRRRIRATGAALAAGALLTAGCAVTGEPGPMVPAAATDETSAPAPSPTPAPSPPATPSAGTTPAPSPETSPATPAPPADQSAGADLRDRLLPASAFGEDATVVSLGAEQLGAGGSGWGGWPGQWRYWGPGDHDHDHDHDHGHDRDGVDAWDEVAVEPAACQAVLEALPDWDEEADGLTLAAQAARTPQTQTVQVLADSPQLEGLQLPVDQLLAECSSVSATGPWGWSTTAEVTRLDVPQLGEQSAGVQVTVDRAGEETVSVLVGIVVGGSRGLVLAQSAAPDAAAPDPAAFTALLTEAAQAATG
ncbi:hypothetical protein [Geodermatophilus sp. SYSU D00710]